MGTPGSLGRSLSVWTSLESGASHSLILLRSAIAACVEVGCPSIVVSTLGVVLRGLEFSDCPLDAILLFRLNKGFLRTLTAGWSFFSFYEVDFQEFADHGLQDFFKTLTICRGGDLAPLVQESARYSSDWCLEMTLQWMPMEFPTRQCLHAPCHWTPVYEQNLCLRFRETQHFEGMHPFVSCFRVFCRPGPIPSLSVLTFWPWFLAFWATPVLWAASGDPLVAGGLVINRHHFGSQGRRDMNHRIFLHRSPSLSSSVTGPVRGSLPRLEEATEPNVGKNGVTQWDPLKPT
eukprot:Gb_11402 [translate_table: standard]